MSKKTLVSIIIPCYNGEKLFGRMLDSIISQTYRPIELVVVNDGSIDNSEAIVNAYEEKLRKADIELKYIYQDNQGLGGAINTGLKHFTGEYLCWADYDDYYHPQSIEHRVEFLESNPEYAVVTSNADIFHEDSLDTVCGKASDGIINNSDENQFWHMLVGDTIFCSGCHMIRTKDFLVANPTRSIYPARRGQNWQLLLPVYYKFKRYFLDESLYCNIIYKNSMSRDFSYEQSLHRFEEHQKIIFETLSNINMTEQDYAKAEKIIKTSYSSRILRLSSKNGDSKIAKENLEILKKHQLATFRHRVEMLLSYMPFVWKVIKK